MKERTLALCLVVIGLAALFFKVEYAGWVLAIGLIAVVAA